ncbi:MAG: hypothetical protein K0R18_353 [Bacillales bacterium]|nr:hypothetical protein [Bacillales bacterium]
MKVARNFTVLITETGEALKHESLEYLLDVIVEHHRVPVGLLLDRIAIIEIQDLQGYTGGTLPIRDQFELISDYMKRNGA